MPNSVAQKMGITEGARAFFVDAPQPALDAMALPVLDIVPDLEGEFDYMHLFTTSQAGLEAVFPALMPHLKPTGMLWVSWPKGGQAGTDLTLPHVIRIGYSHGLVESTCLSVDPTWSALKFTWPKPGTIYANRYGQLPGESSPADVM